ncbi:MAG TPA: tetratricopeptide repeat protein [Candidatus Acidoferrum sp.]|jgi:pilus assembly protein FimV|nr:tetratricopeptide repeat protein [Candidatus Acidoferrum sp.]
MAFNKNKALESALKFLNQGKVAQAIGEYQQILRHDAKDQATLMTVGDLFARQSDMPQAIEYFERLAQVYLNDGFNSKAIAIYKKIAKLAPAELAPLERLADLYVQQGVLSEARPLFLQIAEVHLKANRAPKAVEVLHRLLEVEPDNPRVQMRLAELYNVMGQKKEAAQAYLGYAQRLFDRGEGEEAEKLIERALGVDGASAPALLLKAKILALGQKDSQAIALLEEHPEADAGGEVTDILLELELKSGQGDRAAARAAKQLSRGSAHSKPLQTVVESLIASGQAEKTLPLLAQLRDPMIEATEQDKFVKLLSSAIEKLPGNTQALEMLADFSRHTSDPFHLNAALSQLVDAYAASGDQARAEHLMKELIDRNKGDERLIDRYNQLRRAGKREAAPARELPAEAIAEAEILPEASRMEAPVESGSASASIMESAPEAPARAADEGYDEETQRYIAQALTDVDLFSSYGLTQKATTLLENVLVRAPRHTPTLERLLDLCLGAGNERRTAELAALLEQIHRERQDTVNTERFAELRQRFQKLAGVSVEELPVLPKAPAPAAAKPAPPAAPAAQASHEPATIELDPVVEPEAASSAPMEFEIPLSTVEAEAAAAEPLDPPVAPEPAAVVASAPTEEVDLSDEWEAMVQEVAEPAAAAPEPEEIAIPIPEPVEVEAPATASVDDDRLEIEVPTEEIVVEPVETPPAAAVPVEMEFEIPEAVIVPELTIEPEPIEAAPEGEAIEVSADPELEAEPVELVVEPASQEPAAEFALDPAFEVIEEAAASVPTPEPEPAAAPDVDFELELTPDPAAAGKNGAATTEDFLTELAAEIDDMETPAAIAPKAVVPAAPVRVPAPVAPPVETAPAPTVETLNELAEVFQEFRSELGEIDDGDEDLETHYNLGTAYREMGLLDEAIGEFQKVAKAVQKGKPFQYSMNCATLLAISFIDKGEPKIAALWYQRALDMPGLDQEAVMALRYDLALALDMAGEADAALDSFRQVYAMNIDYRDVADRIATLQKH